MMHGVGWLDLKINVLLKDSIGSLIVDCMI